MFCQHCILCVLRVSAAIISLYSINLSVFITEAESVYSTVRRGSLDQTDTDSSLEGLYFSYFSLGFHSWAVVNTLEIMTRDYSFLYVNKSMHDSILQQCRVCVYFRVDEIFSWRYLRPIICDCRHYLTHFLRWIKRDELTVLWPHDPAPQ